MTTIVFGYLIVFSIVVTLFYVVLVLFYLLGWQSIPFYKSSGKQPKTKLSVVIPARNEENNIPNLLRALRNQNYPKDLYEVIVIDDHSTDNTPWIVEGFEMDNLSLISLSKHVDKDEIAYKKRAVELAVRESNGELIICTDADCTMGSKWLSQIASIYEENNCKFIVAPVDYAPTQSLLDKVQALDFLSIMGMTGASVYHKLYNLSNGANMAYSREVFLEMNAYENDKSASGDDVFLIEKIGNKYPDDIYYLKNRDAIVYTKPCDNFKELFQQRMRWISKTKHYSGKRTKTIAIFLFLFYISVSLNFVLSFFYKEVLNLFIMQIFMKLIVDYALLEDVTRFFKKEQLMKSFPALALTHFPFTFSVSICSQLFKYQWKDRTRKS